VGALSGSVAQLCVVCVVCCSQNPTVVLLDKNKRLLGFGAEAKHKYMQAEAMNEAQDLLYFDNIKSHLYGYVTERPVLTVGSTSRVTAILRVTSQAANGVKLPAVEVLSHVMRVLKQTIIERLMVRAPCHDCSPICVLCCVSAEPARLGARRQRAGCAVGGHSASHLE
jgi:hypothetical protein